MGNKKRSRSRLRSRERKKAKEHEELQNMKNQMEYLTNVVRQLVEGQLAQANDKNKDQTEMVEIPETGDNTLELEKTKTPDENNGDDQSTEKSPDDNKENDSRNVNQEILQRLGEDLRKMDTRKATRKSKNKHFGEIFMSR